MNINTLTQEQKSEMLTILNEYWKEQVLKPKNTTIFRPATKILDIYEHSDNIRIVLKLGTNRIRFMLVKRSIFDNIG